MIFVPLTARATQFANDVVDVKLFGHDFRLDLTLPFTWQIFFAASLFVAAGSFLYSWKCPGIIRDYPDTQSFLNDQHNLRSIFVLHLSPVLLELKGRLGDSLAWHRLLKFVETFCEQDSKILRDMSQSDWSDRRLGIIDGLAKHGRLFDTKTVAEAYWFVKQLSDETHPWFRRCCYACYMIGLFLLFIVLCQNILFVFWGYPSPIHE